MKIHLDTNALIVEPNWSALPQGEHEVFISALVYAEFSEGVHSQIPARAVAAARELLDVEDRYGYGIPFDDRAARMYPSVCGAVVGKGRKVGRRRRLDLMIAATAAADDAAVLTHNVADFAGLEGIVPIIDAGGLRS